MEVRVSNFLKIQLNLNIFFYRGRRATDTDLNERGNIISRSERSRSPEHIEYESKRVAKKW